MLMVIISIFLAVEIPVMIITILHTISNSLYPIMDYSTAESIVHIINVIMTLSYPLNFAIYCSMSK